MSQICNNISVMTPHISPKDIPHNASDSEPEENNVVVNVQQDSSSSDDDDGDVVNEISGYVPLSMSEGNDSNTDNHIQMIESDFIEMENTESHQDISENFNNSITSSSTTIHREETQISMDNDQIQLIQQVMSNISLPSSSVPEWAKVVPEDRWKNSLMTSLESRTHSKTDSERTDNDE